MGNNLGPGIYFIAIGNSDNNSPQLGRKQSAGGLTILGRYAYRENEPNFREILDDLP